ncbi:flagellar biosynthetic protein FliR [Yunchengibacter salinarum]|uniref:flagellar biosynthetic protein FliR n=1 Tax=Yunchengibacter salinarum TaxID=3133399 RepID=UPI0035B5DB7A
MLGDVLPAEAFGYLLVLVRMLPMALIMPALGDRSIPTRIRTTLAMVISLPVYLSVQAHLPDMPASPFGLGALMLRELLLGSMVAYAARVLVSASHVAGTVIAFNTGLAAAQSFDPSQGTQSATVATLLTLIATALIFVTDLHHVLILGMVESYTKFPAGSELMVADFAGVMIGFVSDAFYLGIQMASPFMVYALIFNTGLGLVARLSPSLQIFFIAMPMNILVGFTLLSLVVGTIMRVYLDHVRQMFLGFMG